MSLPVLEPIEYHGELVALVSADRVHIVAPWLAERPAADPDLGFVAFMCAFGCREVNAGRSVDSVAAEAWARQAIVEVSHEARRAGGAT